MASQEFREYIAALESAGELQRIEKEVDWDLEVGAIIRRVYDLRAPAPFFQRIKGYPQGYRILGAPLGFSNRPGFTHARLALVLGMRPDTPITDIMEEYIGRLRNPIKPVLVSAGPCKEHIHTGDDADLDEFPAPLLHGGDGGRYLGTWHTVATKDPDSNWTNWGMYRLMATTRIPWESSCPLISRSARCTTPSSRPGDAPWKWRLPSARIRLVP